MYPVVSMRAIREAERTLDAEAGAVDRVRRRLNRREFHVAADAILAATHVVLSGVGKSGHVGRRGAASLASVGVSATFMHAGEAMHGDCGQLRPGCVLITLSHSGAGAVCDMAAHVVANMTNVLLVAITADCESTLARLAHVTLSYECDADGGVDGLIPTVSCAAQGAYLDALTIAVATTNEIGLAEFGVFHPGGSIGSHIADVTNA